MTQEEREIILTTVEPQTINQEAVPGGSRVLQNRYVHNGGVLIQSFVYANEASSDGWAEIARIDYTDGEVDELPVFRKIAISDHPTIANITRSCDLVCMDINAEKIKLIVLIKHFTDAARTIPAPYTSKTIPMVADNSTIISVPLELQLVGYPATMGERDFWHALTTIGKSVYEMIDPRITELDTLGRFNIIY